MPQLNLELITKRKNQEMYEPERIIEIMKNFQKILVEEVPVTWIHEVQQLTVINANYKNVIVCAIGIAGNFRQGYKS